MICSKLMCYLHMSVHGINVRWMLAGMVRRQVVCVVRKSDDAWKAVWNVAFATEISASPCFWYLWCESVGTCDRTVTGAPAPPGDLQAVKIALSMKSPLGQDWTVRPMNRHVSQCQRTPVLCLAQQNSAVLPVAEHAIFLWHRVFTPFPLVPRGLALSQLGKSLFLKPLLLGLTLLFQYQFRTCHELETSCSFMASAPCLCLWAALVRALLLWLPPACLPLPGCSSAVSNWCPQHRPSIALTSAAGMWGLFALTQELSGGIDTGIGMDMCVLVCLHNFFLVVSKRSLCLFCTRNGQRQ